MVLDVTNTGLCICALDCPQPGAAGPPAILHSADSRLWLVAQSRAPVHRECSRRHQLGHGHDVPGHGCGRTTQRVLQTRGHTRGTLFFHPLFFCLFIDLEWYSGGRGGGVVEVFFAYRIVGGC